MDTFVSSILEEWGLRELIPIFKANAIDEESFRLLDKDSAKDLIPKIGLRLKFLQQFSLFKKLPQETDSESTTCGSSSTSTIILPSSGELSTSLSDMSDSTDQEQDSLGDVNISSQSPPCKVSKMFDVRKILGDAGQDGIVHHLDESSVLSHTERCKMVRVLVSHLIEKHGFRVGTNVKICLAKAVVEDFPQLKDSEGEGYEAWYTKAIGKHPATGYLEERLRNVRKRTKDYLKQASPKAQKLMTPKNKNSDNTSTEELKQMKEWLKLNHAPREKVKDFMRLTQPLRAEMLRENRTSNSVREMLLQFPRLLDTPGMIEQDFLLEHSPLSLKEVWTESVGAKLISYAYIQDAAWKEKLGIDDYNDDDILSISLQLLPILLSCGTMLNINKKRVKATVSESLRGFVEVEPVGTNIPLYVDKIQQDPNKSQPFILVLGDRRRPVQAFVIAESTALPAGDIVEAADVCFKTFYVLDINYPAPCHTSWEFLQEFAFKLQRGRMGQTSPSVRSLRAYLQNQNTRPSAQVTESS